MAAQLQLVAPTVALLEGGYNLLSTAKGTEAVVRVLLGERPPALPPGEQAACEYGMAAVAQVRRPGACSGRAGAHVGWWCGWGACRPAGPAGGAAVGRSGGGGWLGGWGSCCAVAASHRQC